ncbi:TIGR00730 family Rossman fold protein [Aeromicrobium chenweiae]|uniref:Cytokinin riboside 5'-monophosphate phosphoribohydrolase n=1 Tax=Aeromicrobium chenweiae TaxID=2079793 RepID=A0A2S0WMB4_9ACTN|nr:TIGR00730 family Rossman fold protein [Aeromicrobium chenweiae]AWB92465.1 TIGR00730 family Rossman fold protein [Aeromicrobium chenweiae]TGN31243.1 TIGR00730 family Rossman fold protein [Aeromicrobium chenweiae]
MALRSVAVFCGSSFGASPVYAEAARLTGRTLAERGIDVVYGGGHVGLMGTVADAALEAGGRVVGVIPRQLDDRELAHHGLSELHVVESMHARKQLMADLSDAFIALPGGAGTLEEIAEQWTWAQLTIHAKPSGFLDVDGFWAPMRTMLHTMVSEGFVRAEQSGIVSFSDDLGTLLDMLAAPPSWTDKWGAAAPETPQP